jgi:hypothetical protein
MRSIIVILVICGVILLVFSSVWYPAITGEDEEITDAPLDESRLPAPDPRVLGFTSGFRKPELSVPKAA